MQEIILILFFKKFCDQLGKSHSFTSFQFDKMPKFAPVQESSKKTLIEAGGLAQGTIERRNYVATSFQAYVNSNTSGDVSQLLNDLPKLEEVLMNFFMSMRVSKTDSNDGDDLPKRTYFEACKSHVKQYILSQSNGSIDISSSGSFPKLTQLLKGFVRTLKKNGKGDVSHYEEIDKDSLGKIFQFIAKVEQVFQTRGTMEFYDVINDIPANFRYKYHYLLQYCVLFLITFLDVRRAREGLSNMKKTMYVKRTDGNFTYFQKVESELSKNHRQDCANLMDSGIIPFSTDQYGCNPGRVLALYISFLSPESEFMFQRPRRPSKSFSLDMANENGLFEPSKVGENLIAKMLPTICKTLNLRHFTNHSVRTTGIQMLKKSGYSDRAIMKLSGHKAISSLNSYDPHNTLSDKKGMAKSLLMIDGDDDDTKIPVANQQQEMQTSIHGINTLSTVTCLNSLESRHLQSDAPVMYCGQMGHPQAQVKTTDEAGFFTIEPEAPSSAIQREQQLREKELDVKNLEFQLLLRQQEQIRDLTNKLL